MVTSNSPKKPLQISGQLILKKLFKEGLHQAYYYISYLPLCTVVTLTFASLIIMAMQITHNDFSFLQYFSFIEFIDPSFFSGSQVNNEWDLMRVYLKISFIFYVLFQLIKLILKLLKIKINLRPSIWYNLMFISSIHLISIFTIIFIGYRVKPEEKLIFITILIPFLAYSVINYIIYYGLKRASEPLLNALDRFIDSSS